MSAASRSRWLRHGTALLVVVAAVALRELLQPLLGNHGPTLLYWPVVIFAAWHAGPGAGVLATALTSTAIHVFLHDLHPDPTEPATAEPLSLAVFAFGGVVISLLVARVQRARDRAAAAAADASLEQLLMSAELEAERLAGEQAALAAEAVRQSEEHYRSLAESLPTLVWVARPDGFIDYFNRQWVDYTGQPAAASLGWDWKRFVHPDDWPEAFKRWTQALRSGEPFRADYRLLGGDGTYRWHAARGEALRDAGGRVVRWFGTSSDVHERELALDDLARANERFRLAAEAVNGIIYDWDAATGRVERTRGLFEVLGYRPEEAGADNDWWRSLVHPDDAANAREAVTTATAGRFEVEYRVRHKDGDYRHVLDRGCVVCAGDGALVRVVGCLVDITERVRLVEELKDVGRRKDEFIALLAHELRNPLAPMVTALRLLRDDPSDGDACAAMERQVRQLSRLVDDLLDLARAGRGKVRLKRQPVELGRAVAAAVETVRPQVALHRHELRVALPERPVWLDADPARLTQVFGNLLANAVKYQEDGGRIDVAADFGGGEVTVRVCDRGVGIPAEMLPHVFEMFTQVGSAVHRSHGGLGIGLSLVRSLVDLHGGRVAVTSAGAGRGSEFAVTLPVVAAPAVRDSGDGQRALKLGPPPTGRERVLITDDNRDAADTLGRLLSAWGHTIRVEYDGPTALTAARDFRPGVVLLDIGLGGMTGYEVAERMRRDPEMAGVRLIAVTGFGQEEDRRQSRQAGFDHHLVKPVDPDELRTLLATLP